MQHILLGSPMWKCNKSTFLHTHIYLSTYSMSFNTYENNVLTYSICPFKLSSNDQTYSIYIFLSCLFYPQSLFWPISHNRHAYSECHSLLVWLQRTHGWPIAAFERVSASQHTVLPFSDEPSLEGDPGPNWIWHNVKDVSYAKHPGLSFETSRPEDDKQPEREEEQVAPHLPLSLLTHS